MPRILAIDLGTKRTGLAVTDPLKMLASPLETIETSTLLDFLKSYCAKEEVDTLVLGYPTRLNGKDNEMTPKVITMKDRLSKAFPDKKIELVDERFTSKMAMQSMITMGSKKKDRKEVAEEITEGTELDELIKNMYATMDNAKGVGLAAPQINQGISLFVIDSTLMLDEDDSEVGIRRAFINPIILDEYGDDYSFEEGCLSIPDIHADITRPDTLTIEYYDENWNLKEEEFSGMTARVIQHEFDHLEGILFVDYLKGLKKRMVKSKLIDVSKGKVSTDYRMIYPLK